MEIKSNKAAYGKTLIRSVLIGGTLGFGIMITGALITTLLVDLKKIELESIRYGAVLTHLVAAFVSALVAQSITKEGLIATSLANGGVYMLLLAAINFLVYGDGFSGFLATLGVVIAGSLAAVLVKTRFVKRKKYPMVRF